LEFAGRDEFAAIDWSRAWLSPWRERGEALARHAAAVSLVDALNLAGADEIRLGAGRLQFVPHDALPAGESYEAFIARTACVPTRENTHDFFNGLAWLLFPQLKRRVHELQAEQLGTSKPGAPRGAVRDALTVFDENAALLRAPEVLVDALRRRDWHALFVTHRAAWAEASLQLFGHALLEKLIRPRKPITAHVWWVAGEGSSSLSACTSASLTPASLRSKPFMPLPVLGVPGWWAENEMAGFYDDKTVFRPPQ
jgi:hypothetical protein